MAFDHPVEADRVDLSLMSIMARAPVIGSLFYILGGRHAKEEEDYESSTRKQIDFAISDDQSSSNRPNGPIKSAMKKSSLSLASTDYSETEESFRSAAEIHGEMSDSDLSLYKKKKELSWSDQSGQSLVEYMETFPSSTGKEILALNGMGGGSGGMTRSRSIRHQLEENQMHALRTSQDKSYLPTLSSQGNGVAMPTMNGKSHQHNNNNGGIESPQWGWYMNLTPPSPDMYPSHPTMKKRDTGSSTSTASTAASEASVQKRPSTKPNPIFQNLPSQRKECANCPSMPL